MLKPEGFVLAVLLSWQRLHRPRMRCGSLGSKPASTSSMRSIGQWSAMVLGAPHRPWCLPHPSGPSPGQTHRGSLASTRARARRCAFDVYGLRPRVRRLSLAFLHSWHSEPEETRCGQPEVEHTLYINPPSSRKRGIGLPATLRYAHSDGSGRSVSDMPFGQDGVTQPKELGESKVDMKRVQTACLRFEPSNPLTIMPCTSRNVKSSRVGKAACARRRDGRAAVPSRSCRPVESCRDCATSRSCSRRIGTRIRAAVPHTPPP